MQYLTSFLLGATMVVAAPLSIPQITPRSPLTFTASARMSTAEVASSLTTCWGGKLPMPSNGQPMPCADQPSKQLSVFTKPDSKANTLVVHNYCDYDIHYLHLGNGLNNQGTLAKRSTIEQPLSGTVFKASKSSDMSKDILIEYANVNGNVFYDLSLITCMSGTDLSGCAGHDGGLQLGNQQGMSFQCPAGSWCDDQVYLYQVRDSY